MLTRRTAMLASASAAAGLLPLPLLAQTAPQVTQIGDLQVVHLHDGFAERALEGFVRNASAAEVAAAAGLPGPEAPLVINYTALAVKRPDGGVTLIDTGNGDMGPPKSGTWAANLEAAGLSTDQVDQIVISHFHGDHINGLRLKDGTIRFPKAVVHVPAPEFAFWMSAENAAAAPEARKGAFANVQRVFGPGGLDPAQVKTFTPGAEVVPGIASIAAHGHSPGHTVYRIQSGRNAMLFLADTTNDPRIFATNPEWQVMFDMDAEQAITTRKSLLDQAAADQLPVAFYHAPYPAIGRISRAGAGYRFEPMA